MKTPHKHREMIIAWANGMELQYQSVNGDWRDFSIKSPPAWHDDMSYRIKPPRVYPKTSMTAKELLALEHKLRSQTGIYNDAFVLAGIADAAIQRYIEDIEK